MDYDDLTPEEEAYEQGREDYLAGWRENEDEYANPALREAWRRGWQAERAHDVARGLIQPTTGFKGRSV
jgi:hypothetical protein